MRAVDIFKNFENSILFTKRPKIMKYLLLPIFLLLVSFHSSTGKAVWNPWNLLKPVYNPKNVIRADPDPNIIFPMVTTPLGQLRGKTSYSRGGKIMYGFRGVPFAQPPKRFEEAVMVEPWEGMLDARQDGAFCMQVDQLSGQIKGEENCLSLNIFFPHYDRCQNESLSGLLPVYLHIHGGGFLVGGGAEMGPGFLLDECLVYVAINYRLGPLGFLTTGDDVIPGNLGMKDQVLALQWIQKYIEYFRGDPSVVNINGISAGGSSVSHHITSPRSAGLFTSVIASSGCVTTSFSIQEKPEKYAFELGTKLGCPNQTGISTDLKECLLALDAATMIANQVNGQFLPFAPVIEPKTAASPFQTENPAVLLRNGDFNRVPLLIGFTQDEGITLIAETILADPEQTSQLNNSWYEVAPTRFMYEDLDLTQEEKDRISRDIRQFYFGDEDVGLTTRKKLVDLYSDRVIVQGAMESMELHSQFAPVYAYVVTYKGGFTYATEYGYEIPVITHGEDGQYIYGPSSDTPTTAPGVGTEQYEFSRKLLKYWTHFAKTGTPASIESEVSWNPSMGDTIHQLDVKDNEFVGYLGERRTFWKNLGLAEHEFN